MCSLKEGSSNMPYEIMAKVMGTIRTKQWSQESKLNMLKIGQGPRSVENLS